MARIIVIGAGVIGLTTAYLLQKEGHKVLIVAKSLPGDMDIEYTSPFAGSRFLPSVVLTWGLCIVFTNTCQVSIGEPWLPTQTNVCKARYGWKK